MARDQAWSWVVTPIGRNLHCLPSFEDFVVQNLLGFAKPLHVRIGCWGKELGDGGSKDILGWNP